MRAGLALMLIVLASSATAEWSIEPMVEQDGVRYFMATGEMAAGHFSPRYDADGTNQEVFEGCGFAKLRPSTDRGRFTTHGLIQDRTWVMVSVDEFKVRDGKSIQLNSTVDGSQDHATPQYPAVNAHVVATGTATMYIDGKAYRDPATGDHNYTASVLISSEGFRDDATGSMLDAQGNIVNDPAQAAVRAGDEMHLRLESINGAIAPDEVNVFERPPTQAGIAQTYYAPNEAYSDWFNFTNWRYGGTLDLDIRAAALSPQGGTELDLIVRRPDGMPVANVTLTPSLNDDQQVDVQVPLDQFGSYRIEVRGKVDLGQYSVVATQRAAGETDLNFWWDDVQYGVDAAPALNECLKKIGDPYGEAISVTNLRPDPPQWAYEIVLLSIAGTLAAVLVAVKLVGTAITHEAENKSKR